MSGMDKLDCLQIGHIHIIILVSTTQKLVKSFGFSAISSILSAFQCTLVLVIDGKRVAKCARQSQQANSSFSNLDNSNHNNLINIIES